MSTTLRSAAAAFLAAATAAVAAPPQPVNLEILTWYNAGQAKQFQSAVAEYERGHPDVKITVNTVAGTGAAMYPNTLRTRIAGGRAPDVFMMWGGTLARPFIDSRAARDLAPYYERHQWGRILNPVAVDRIRHAGSVWGVPVNVRAIALFFRKDLFADAGLAVPASFSDLESHCEKLRVRKIACIAAAGTFGWHLMRVFGFFLEHTAGPQLHDQLLEGSARWDRPEVVAAFALLKKWNDRGWFAPGYVGLTPNQAQHLFLQGRAAMIPEGDWFVPIVDSAGLATRQYGFFAPPTDREPQRMAGFVEQYMISAQTRNADAAAVFIDWWVQPRTQVKYYSVHGSTASRGVLPDPAVQPQAAGYAAFVARHPTYLILDQAFSPEVMSTTFFRVQAAVVAGRLTPESAAAEMQAGLRRP